jgi:hypothetical protein
MRFCAIYSDSHRSFLDNFFLKTFPFEYNISLVLERMEQKCDGGIFSRGWRDQMIKKQRFINKHLNNTPDPTIVFCDVDISFYGDLHDDIQRCLGDNDIAFMKDHNSDEVGRCGGFFAVRNSNKIKKLFSTVLQTLESFTDSSTTFDSSEQKTINKTLNSMPEISWTYLPPRYYTHGLYIEGIKNWDQESQRGLWWNSKTKEEKQNVFIPDDIKVHHGNWANGIESKTEVLNFVYDKVKGKDGQ